MKKTSDGGTASRPGRKAAGVARDDGKVTLGMVAAAAGVSPSTVSRTLNGTATVSDDKRAAVDHAIATLGFVPNPGATPRTRSAASRCCARGAWTASSCSPAG
jgi:hypothetical protein